jgi:hypothetical protein
MVSVGDNDLITIFLKFDSCCQAEPLGATGYYDWVSVFV